MTAHQFRTRVYYEDTDLAGIVYYANYLKFIERARTEWVASLGVDQMALKAAQGIVFAVRRVEADFLRPAKFGDDLVVETRLQMLGGARIGLGQIVLRGGDAGLPDRGRPCGAAAGGGAGEAGGAAALKVDCSRLSTTFPFGRRRMPPAGIFGPV